MEVVLVIGGAGFIGSHLIESLLASGRSVVSLDNYLSGSVENHIIGCEYFEGTAKSISDVLSSCSKQFDTVFYLGEYSRVETSFDDIDVVFENNHGSLYEVLKFCRDNSCKLVYSGSSTKFGDGGLAGNSSPYAWTKRINTELVLAFAEWFSLDFAITYFYNAYGGREISEGRFSTVVAKFIDLKRQGASSLPVVSPGSQERNFTHVDDITSALILVGESGNGDGYGIGSDEAITILQLVSYLQCEARMIPERVGNRMKSDLITHKTLELGWRPKWTLKSYIESLNL